MRRTLLALAMVFLPVLILAQEPSAPSGDQTDTEILRADGCYPNPDSARTTSARGTRGQALHSTFAA